MSPPQGEPIGLQLARTAKSVSRAFDEALSGVGGSLPAWLIMIFLKSRRHGAQREIAEAVGIEGPTLTHHLNRLERAGLVTRTRQPDNRRVHQVELTDAGEAAFSRMRGAAQSFDHRLRAGLDEQQLAVLGELLATLRHNAATVPEETRLSDG